MADNNTYGLLAEFKDPHALLQAAVAVRDAGYKKFDCHSPFPVHGMDAAMGLKKSILGWIVAICAFGGAGGAMLLQWWTGSVAYPFVISGKPFFSFPAFIPVTFELSILSAGIVSVLALLGLNKLPRLHHPLFNSEQFAKASNDSFFISIEATDAKFKEAETKKFLESIGSMGVEVIKDE